MPQESSPGEWSVENIYGLDQKSKDQLNKAELILQELINSESVVTLMARDTAPERFRIKHERDVAEDTDIYTKEVDTPQTRVVGWMLPVDRDGRTGFVIITPDFTASVHLIHEFDRSIFEMARDRLSPGKTHVVNDPNRMHTDGVNIDYEDRPARLTPTNPDHQDQINEYLRDALNQARERVMKGIEAERDNRKKTLTAFDEFSDSLRNETNPDNT